MRNQKVLAICKKYNNSTNVLFMMQADDFRLGDGNYSIVCVGKFSKKVLHTEQGNYTVFSDWSVKKVA